MTLKPPLRIRQSNEAVWIEDASGQRCCFTYFDHDAGMRPIRQRWSHEVAVAIVKTAARALAGEVLNVEPSHQVERSTEHIYEDADQRSLDGLRQTMTTLKPSR